MRAGSSRSLSFRSGDRLAVNATRHSAAEFAREMETRRGEFRCAESRFFLEDSPARSQLAVAIRSAPALLSPSQAFVEWHAGKQAYACRPGHPRREKKQAMASATSRAGASRARR